MPQRASVDSIEAFGSTQSRFFQESSTSVPGVRHLIATRFDVHDLVLHAFVGGLCASVIGQMITVPFDVVSQHMMLIGAAQSRGAKKLGIAK